jgi:type I restriction enzyme S subunit
MSEKRNVPKLRFPETAGEWTTHRLDEISKIERGRFSPRPRNNPIYYGGKIPFVQTGDVVRSNGRISTYSQTLNEKGLEVSKLFSAGSILITIAANIGFSGILQEPMACPDSLIGLTCKSGVNNVFLNYLLQIEQPNMDLLASAAAQKNINVEFLKPYKFNLPSLPEQQKIAEFLTTVDRRIELLQAKKKKLEAYKKGVMQKIFSQQLRFKADDGSEFPDWEERKLGDVAKFSKGKGISKSDISEAGTQECIRYGELYTEYAEVIDRVLSKTEVDSSTLVLSQANDVIIPSSGETQIDIARAACVLRSGIALGGDLNIIRSTLNGVFLSFYLNHRRKHEIAKMAQGISVVHLYNSQLQELIIEVPFLEEQKKIVQFLTSLDGSIENLNQQINHTQTWKKGLLQQLFV